MPSWRILTWFISRLELMPHPCSWLQGRPRQIWIINSNINQLRCVWMFIWKHVACSWPENMSFFWSTSKIMFFFYWGWGIRVLKFHWMNQEIYKITFWRFIMLSPYYDKISKLVFFSKFKKIVRLVYKFVYFISHSLSYRKFWIHWEL